MLFEKFVVYSDLDCKNRIGMVTCTDNRISTDKEGHDVWIFSINGLDVAIFDISEVIIKQERWHE